MDDLTKVSFTNLEKIIYPALDLKKSRLIEYYIRVAPWMLGSLKNRVIVMNRYPDGVDKDGFYEKDAPAGIPPWVETFKTYSEQHNGKYIMLYAITWIPLSGWRTWPPLR